MPFLQEPGVTGNRVKELPCPEGSRMAVTGLAVAEVLEAEGHRVGPQGCEGRWLRPTKLKTLPVSHSTGTRTWLMRMASIFPMTKAAPRCCQQGLLRAL